MNFEYFIAKRLITSKYRKSTISAPIIKIAIAAIAIGMIMMIISVATGVGLQQKIRQKIAAFSGHIIISNFDDNQSQVSLEPISINQNFYPKFNKVSGVKHIQAVATKAGIIRTQTAFEGVIFKGVGKDYNWINLKEYITQGKLPTVSTSLNNEIIISQYLAQRLNLKINQNFNTFFIKESGNKLPNLRVFKIVGIYNSGFQEFDAAIIIGDIRHIQKINRWQPNQIGSFEVFIDDFSEITQKGQEIYQQTNSTLTTTTIQEKYYYIFEWLKLFDFNIIVILIIMIVVASINMAVTLLVMIIERTQMIGVLKSMGANNWSIRKIFLYNAFHIITRGLLFGNIIGISLLFIQKYLGIITLNPENYFVNQAPVDINMIYILLLNISTIIICILVLIIPSFIITKITPVKSLRFS